MSLSWRYAAISDTGRSRKNNQDSGYAGEHLLCVADGMGGAAAGDLASSVVVSTMRRLDEPAAGEGGASVVRQAPGTTGAGALGTVERATDTGPETGPDTGAATGPDTGAGSGATRADTRAGASADTATGAVTEQQRDPDSPTDRAGTELLEAMAGAVLRANDRLGEIIESDPTVDGMGTTATAIVTAHGHAGLVHIGDSRAYLLRAGRLRQLTGDHTLVQSLVDEGRISAHEARYHPHRSVILRALDGRQEIQPDLELLDLHPGDRLLICSDGLSGFVDDERIRQVLASGTVDSAAVDLLRLALDSDSTDNVTCVVAEVYDDVSAPHQRTLSSEDTAEDDLAAASTGPMLVGAVAEESRARSLATPAPPRRRGAASGSNGASAAVAAGTDADDPEQLRYAPRPPGRFRRLRGLALALLVLALLAAAIYLGYAWTQRQYFVADSGGAVTIYRGVQLDVPGVSLSEEYESTDIAVADLPDYNAQQVTEGMETADLADARAIVTRLDELARACARSQSETAECEGAGQGSARSLAPTASHTGPSGAPAARWWLSVVLA